MVIKNIKGSAVAVFWFVSKNRSKTIGDTTANFRIADLPTSVLLIVVENLVIDVHLSPDFIEQHLLSSPPVEQKVIFRKPTPVNSGKQHSLSANAIFTNKNTQTLDINTHDEDKDKGSTIKHSKTV